MTRLPKFAAIAASLVAAMVTTSAIVHTAPAPTQWYFESIADGPAHPEQCTREMSIVGFDYDPDGRPVIAWAEPNTCGGPPTVWWRRLENGAWSLHGFRSGLHYDGGGLDGYYHQMAIRPSDGHPFLIYRDVAPGNFINTYTSDLDLRPDGGVIGNGPPPDVFLMEPLVGPQNCAYMSYGIAFATDGAGPSWATGLTKCNNTGFVGLNGETIYDGASPHVALTMTPDHGGHVLWSVDNNVFYRGPTSIRTLVTNANRFGADVAITSNPTGALHAVVRGVDSDADFDLGGLAYFTSTDGGITWSPLEYIDADDDAIPGSIGGNADISLALDRNGVPAVTYWRFQQELWFAKRDGPNGTWTRSLVTVMPYTGVTYSQSAKISFDSGNTPVVAFYDRVINKMRLARPVTPDTPPQPIDIAVSGSVTPAATFPGGPATFKITVTNRGTTNVDHVVLTNHLPAGFTITDVQPAPATDADWHIGLLTSQASATVTITATAPDTIGDFVDTAFVRSDGFDAAPKNNSTAFGGSVLPGGCFTGTPPDLPECSPVITPGLDVAASVVALPNPVVTNGVISYRLKATNTGTVTAPNVFLRNALPSGAIFVDAVPAVSSVDGNSMTWEAGTLVPGASAFVLLHAIAPSTAGAIVDETQVSAAGDVNAANDIVSASDTVKVDACFVTPTNLVSRWRAESNASDDIGGLLGEWHGSPIYALGHAGNGFQFDGSTSYVSVPDTPALRPAQLTVSAWIDPHSIHNSYYDVIVSKGHNFVLGLHQGLPYFYANGEFATASTAVLPNQWHLLTGTFDGVAERIYVDGVLAASQSIGALSFDNSPLGIGALEENGQVDTADMFNGVIDEVTFHNRALSDAEVLGLYDGSSPSCPPPPPPPDPHNTQVGTPSVFTALNGPGETLSTVTFSSVTQSGDTAVSGPLTFGPGAPPQPTGFVVGGLLFDISTTAIYTPPIDVCIFPARYGLTTPATALRFLHFENGQWVDRTSFSDTAEVCATVTSLSPFFIGTPSPLPPPPPPPSDPPALTPGRMFGEGHVGDSGLEHHFRFSVTERRNGADFGDVDFWIRESDRPRKPGRELNRFDASRITAVTFSDDPGFTPGRGPSPKIDTVVFSGAGCWNGRPGYTFEARASDEGEPGRGRDTFTITIRDPRGNIVATVSGTLAGGNIQSLRLPGR